MTSYGGIFERGSREYTLDDFYAIALDKMDRYVCLKKSEAIILVEGDDESSSSEDDDEDGDDSDEGDEVDEEMLDEEEAPEIKGTEEEVAVETVGGIRDTEFFFSNRPFQAPGFTTRPSDRFYGGVKRHQTF
jgi:hypothetical protein